MRPRQAPASPLYPKIRVAFTDHPIIDENCRRNPGGTERSLAEVGASCGFLSRVHASRSLLSLKIECRSGCTRLKHGVLL
jgi:hypothetical protein